MQTINLLVEGKATYTDGGVVRICWIIVALPFIAALGITFFKSLPLKGAEIALGSVFIFI